jgi:uncharacterized protein (TIGR03792 family)
MMQWLTRHLMAFCLVMVTFLGTFSLAPQSSAEMLSFNPVYPAMVIEWLKIEVAPDYRDLYLQTDEAIWTKALETYPGFVDKATWLNPNHPTEIIFVIRWASREQWKAIPEAEIQKINQQFDAAFPYSYTLSEEKEFEVFSPI